MTRLSLVLNVVLPGLALRLGQAVFLVLLLAGFVAGSGMSTAQATPLCRQLGEHQVCLLDIKRSAKNYWEYRAVVKIDGKRQPMAVYSCRDRLRTVKKTGQVIPFAPQGAGQLICQLLYR